MARSAMTKGVERACASPTATCSSYCPDSSTFEKSARRYFLSAPHSVNCGSDSSSPELTGFPSFNTSNRPVVSTPVDSITASLGPRRSSATWFTCTAMDDALGILLPACSAGGEHAVNPSAVLASAAARRRFGCWLPSATKRITETQSVHTRRIVVSLDHTAVEAAKILGVFVGHVLTEELDVVPVFRADEAERQIELRKGVLGLRQVLAVVVENVKPHLALPVQHSLRLERIPRTDLEAVLVVQGERVFR